MSTKLISFVFIICALLFFVGAVDKKAVENQPNVVKNISNIANTVKINNNQAKTFNTTIKDVKTSSHSEKLKQPWHHFRHSYRTLVTKVTKNNSKLKSMEHISPKLSFVKMIVLLHQNSTYHIPPDAKTQKRCLEPSLKAQSKAATAPPLHLSKSQ